VREAGDVDGRIIRTIATFGVGEHAGSDRRTLAMLTRARAASLSFIASSRRAAARCTAEMRLNRIQASWPPTGNRTARASAGPSSSKAGRRRTKNSAKRKPKKTPA